MEMHRQQTELVVWSWAHSGCCRWGSGFCFSKDPDTRQWQYCLHAAYLPCDISLLSQCLHFPSTPLLLSLSLCPPVVSLGRDCEGKVRWLLWQQQRMTARVAEHCLCMCVCVCVRMCMCVIGRSYFTVFIVICVLCCICPWRFNAQ